MTANLPFWCRSWQAIETKCAKAIICMTDARIQSIQGYQTSYKSENLNENEKLTIEPEPAQVQVSQWEVRPLPF